VCVREENHFQAANQIGINLSSSGLLGWHGLGVAAMIRVRKSKKACLTLRITNVLPINFLAYFFIKIVLQRLFLNF